jgi:hypothetical protein
MCLYVAKYLQNFQFLITGKTIKLEKYSRIKKERK